MIPGFLTSIQGVGQRVATDRVHQTNGMKCLEMPRVSCGLRPVAFSFLKSCGIQNHRGSDASCHWGGQGCHLPCFSGSLQRLQAESRPTHVQSHSSSATTSMIPSDVTTPKDGGVVRSLVLVIPPYCSDSFVILSLSKMQEVSVQQTGPI